MSYRNQRPNSYGRHQQITPRRGNNRIKKENIHPSRFIKAANQTMETEYTPTLTFAGLEIHPLIKTNLLAKDFARPTEIQEQTIPIGLLGQDVVGIANTGTGKTAAFAIPLLHSLMTKIDSRALILAPTRELAEQIDEQCRSIAKGSGLRGALLIGGVAMGPQLRDLRDNPRIVIGTPGRIKDHLERRSLNLARFNIVVLDEVDRMLDMGFINDIRRILDQTADKKQSFFFSATLDARVKAIIDGFSVSPVHITVKSGDTSENVDQNIVKYTSKGDKIDKLHNLLIQNEVVKTLVFDDTHRSVEHLCRELQTMGFEADAIHGGKSQSQRKRALTRFKSNQVNVLVATDVAARGLDVADITHVVNYSAPNSYSDYVHRIGRTGRAGRLGYALTFVEQ